MRSQFVLSEIGINLRRNVTMTVAVIISVALSLALAGSALLLRDQVALITFVGWGPVFQAMPLMLVLGIGMSSLAALVTLRKYLRI